MCVPVPSLKWVGSLPASNSDVRLYQKNKYNDTFEKEKNEEELPMLSSNDNCPQKLKAEVISMSSHDGYQAKFDNRNWDDEIKLIREAQSENKIIIEIQQMKEKIEQLFENLPKNHNKEIPRNVKNIYDEYQMTKQQFKDWKSAHKTSENKKNNLKIEIQEKNMSMGTGIIVKNENVIQVIRNKDICKNNNQISEENKNEDINKRV